MIEDVTNQRTVVEANKAFKSKKGLSDSTTTVEIEAVDESEEIGLDRWKF